MAWAEKALAIQLHLVESATDARHAGQPVGAQMPDVVGEVRVVEDLQQLPISEKRSKVRLGHAEVVRLGSMVSAVLD